MKSGTTTLFDALSRHPQISPANPKEPGFFAFPELWEKGFDWYDSLFDFDPERHAYRLDGSTDYAKAPFVSGVWERMTADPDTEVKLLYIMRHPLRRLESHARHTQGARKELGQEISRKADHSLDAGISPLNMAVSLYASQLDAYREAWITGQLHCLTLEELKDDPTATMERVYAFLGLDGSEAAEELPVSNVAGSQSRVHPLWEAALRIKPLLAVGKALLPKTLRDRLHDRARQKIVTEGRFTLDADETRVLERLYAPDLARLRDEYRVDPAGLWGLDPERPGADWEEKRE